MTHTSPANGVLARYCFGGAIAARLGSTNSVNAVVIAHPAKLTSDQMRAIKVIDPSISSAVCLTLAIPQVPVSWLLAEG